MSEKKPRPYKHPQINLRIPEELKEEIQKFATKKGLSMNAQIISFLDAAVTYEKHWYHAMEQEAEFFEEPMNEYGELTPQEINDSHGLRQYVFTEKELKEFIDNTIKNLSSSMTKLAEKYYIP